MSARRLPDPPVERINRGPRPACTCGACPRCKNAARSRRWYHAGEPTDEELDRRALKTMPWRTKS
jgi:hypothetical protein